MTREEINAFITKEVQSFSLTQQTLTSINSLKDIPTNETFKAIHTLSDLLPKLICNVVEENNRIISKQISEIISDKK